MSGSRTSLDDGHVGFIGVLFGWFGWKIEGPDLPGRSIIYRGHLFSKKDTYGWIPQIWVRSIENPQGHPTGTIDDIPKDPRLVFTPACCSVSFAESRTIWLATLLQIDLLRRAPLWFTGSACMEQLV